MQTPIPPTPSDASPVLPGEPGAAGGPADVPESSGDARKVEQAVIHTPATGTKINEKMLSLSRAGKLPGYKPAAEGFHALAYGWVYDFDLVAAFTPQGSGTSVKFALAVRPKMPWIVAAALLLSVFPGVWVTHSMLSIYFSWYPGELWKTCAWYLPVSILPIPWVWKRAMDRSRVAAEESGLELIERIGAALEARVDFRSVP
ncbi:MAG: hypothetical protein U0573_15430 [Phycisphaerales bacterium]